MNKWTWLSLNHKNISSYDDIIENLTSKSFTGVNVNGAFEDIISFAKLAAKYDLKINYWFWTLINTDPDVQKEHPDWFNVSRFGFSSLTHPPYVGYYKWYCPNKNEVQNYILDRIGNICKEDLLNGIHLDYVRYPDVILPEAIQPNYGLNQTSESPQFDFCYCDTCREKFSQIDGRDPMAIDDPASDRKWLNFRLDSVNHLVDRISKLVHSYKKDISAAVFPHPELAVNLVRQDWTTWDMDYIFPMIYYNFYYKKANWISDIALDLEERYNFSTPVFPGIYLPEMDKVEFERCLKIIKKADFPGVSFFPYNSLISKSFMQSL